MPLGLKPQLVIGNLQGLTSTPPRRCLAFGACNLEVVYCCQGLKDEIFKLPAKCLVIQAVGLEEWMQAKRPHNFVLNAFDVSVSWTMKSVLGPWRTRKGFNGKEVSFVCFWIHFFLQLFSVELIKKLLVS